MKLKNNNIILSHGFAEDFCVRTTYILSINLLVWLEIPQI